MEHRGEPSRPAKDRPSVIYKDFLLIQLAALIFLADQVTKFLVQRFLFFGESFPREGFLRLSHTHNTGSAFGLFQGQNTPLIVVALVGIAILVLIYHSQRHPSALLRLSIGLQLGGAFGNLADRLFLGYVVDFLDVGPWPVFNVADSSIVVGLVLLAWLFLMPHRRAQPLRAGGAWQSDGSSAAGEPTSWCPVCDGDMVLIRSRWRCSTCGVKETVEQLGMAGSIWVVTPSESHTSGLDHGPATPGSSA
ncbi:MAG: signal peptidase II, partial [Chloroflexi bacterium]|nr:signal peptidase II [Chloroflexota bacterium]